MYLPKHFEETRPEVLHAFIRANPLATLVAHTSEGLIANHIPMEFAPAADSAGGVLRGHIARANPLWSICSMGVDVLSIFQGPDAYITPSWYPTKQESGKAVPTWAYAVTHVYGKVRFIHDPNWLRSLVSRLSDKQEASRPEPWAVSDAPVEYIERLLGAIVGIEIVVTRMQGKWKVDQNKPERDRVGAAEGLRTSGDGKAEQLAGLIADRRA